MWWWLISKFGIGSTSWNFVKYCHVFQIDRTTGISQRCQSGLFLLCYYLFFFCIRFANTHRNKYRRNKYRRNKYRRNIGARNIGEKKGQKKGNKKVDKKGIKKTRTQKGTVENKIFLVFIKGKVGYEKCDVKGGGIKVVGVCCLWKNKRT